MANRIVEELIKKSKAASIKNRGAYPVTAAKNTFKLNGECYEDLIPVGPKEPVLPSDTTVDPTNTESTLASVMSSAEDGSVIDITEGSVSIDLAVDKSVTLQGTNAGIAQNFDQEVK